MDAGFLKAILDNPDDDAPRLIYADWLDEHGQLERAEFIRVQIELAKCRDGIESCPPVEPRCGRCYGCVRRERERDLLCWIDTHEQRTEDNYGPGWWAEGPGAILPDLNWSWTWRRGFMESIRLDAADWLEWGPSLVRSAPIEEVTLTDWRCVVEQNGPAYLMVPTTGAATAAMSVLKEHGVYRSQREAELGLSAACLRWAKRLVCGTGGTVWSNDGPSLPVSRWRVSPRR